jgi:aspartate kinase
MALIVHKYGGTSMGSTERIRSVARRVAKWVRAGHQMVVVPSAMSGETNRLLGLAKELSPAASTPRPSANSTPSPPPASRCRWACWRWRCRPRACRRSATAAGRCRSHRLGLHQGAHQSIDDTRVRADLAAGKVVIITGFQGIDAEGNVTTLGRGGSDTSAVAVAAAMKADECLIYTDVDGVYTTDPRIVPEARACTPSASRRCWRWPAWAARCCRSARWSLPASTACRCACCRASRPGTSRIDEECRSGTLITFEEDEKMEQAVVSGIAFNRDEAKITVMGVPDKPGIAYQILGPVADANIDIDVIIQNVSHDGKTDFSSPCTATTTRARWTC